MRPDLADQRLNFRTAQFLILDAQFTLPPDHKAQKSESPDEQVQNDPEHKHRRCGNRAVFQVYPEVDRKRQKSGNEPQDLIPVWFMSE